MAPPAAEVVPVPAAAPDAAAPEQEIKALLLVDDEEDVRRILAQSFTQGGYQVVEAEDPDAAVKKASRLSKAGISFVLVADLGMPTSGGSSFQGGFEVVKRLVKMKLDPPILMMTESLSQAVRARAKQMGITSFVFKPSLSKLDPEQHKTELRAFAEKLLSELLPALTRRSERKSPRAAPAGKPKPAAAAEGAAGGGSRDLRALQSYLAELTGSPDASRISALVMKVAREFYERALLFLIRNEEVRGLGGFGAAGSGENVNLVSRQLLIPLKEPSVFLDVVSSGRPWHGALPDAKWSQYLMGRIGRFRSEQVSLVPLVAHRDTIAIVFGDNPETGRAPERLESFELFMHQAGIAMENAMLQRKLKAVQEKG
jgi:CheY-like chemotaxis protein